ncbi:hypothetical protein TNCV_1935051 [Trichonephila clavipes]|nr:hypothetical protein TNCV_1935051 [Trichonephila clavipes]
MFFISNVQHVGHHSPTIPVVEGRVKSTLHSISVGMVISQPNGFRDLEGQTKKEGPEQPFLTKRCEQDIFHALLVAMGL